MEGAGVALAQQYKAQGLNMLHEHAQFEDGSVSVEAGLMAMLTRMQMGKLKVFNHLNDWFDGSLAILAAVRFTRFESSARG